MQFIHILFMSVTLQHEDYFRHLQLTAVLTFSFARTATIAIVGEPVSGTLHKYYRIANTQIAKTCQM